MLVLSAAAVRSKFPFRALLMTGARRFALTGLYQAGIAGTAIELASGWIGVPQVAPSPFGVSLHSERAGCVP
jgi:hypothetical protein